MQPDGARAFELRFAHALDARADDFADVGAAEDREDERADDVAVADREALRPTMYQRNKICTSSGVPRVIST